VKFSGPPLIMPHGTLAHCERRRAEVRFRGKPGKHLLTSRPTGFDPISDIRL
jgi:hypothetical protein